MFVRFAASQKRRKSTRTKGDLLLSALETPLPGGAVLHSAVHLVRSIEFTHMLPFAAEARRIQQRGTRLYKARL